MDNAILLAAVLLCTAAVAVTVAKCVREVVHKRRVERVLARFAIQAAGDRCVHAWKLGARCTVEDPRVNGGAPTLCRCVAVGWKGAVCVRPVEAVSGDGGRWIRAGEAGERVTSWAVEP